ncbi:MAG: alanine--tRNA ligase, partial [Parafilimonas sp.]
KDNFWEMGDTGPCGPCTEIHVDSRTDEERNAVDGKTLVNKDHPQVIEIWNVVFIQFNRLKDGSLEPLPAKHVDTGMGFERLVRVLQGTQSNYDTDVFTGIIAETEKITNKKYDYSDSKEAIAFRVLADHIRAISFTIADGQLPSNTGAAYVIRRILRRAVRYYYSYLNYKQPLLFQLVPVVSKQFENVFPELQKQVDFVSKVIMEEEESFLRTLEKGLKKIDEIISVVSKQPGKRMNGTEVFELYDTYGFPIDLTRLIAAENNLTVDEEGFKKEMEQQKKRSRVATAIDAEDWVVLDTFALNEFVGYDSLEIKSKIVKYRKVKTKGKEAYQIVLEASPFYAESGGQVGDTGEFQIADFRLQIFDTKKENDLIIHFTDKLPTDFTEQVIAKVDAERRKAIAIHHSATHLLHAALRKVLGTHVTQKGSLVNAEHLRFDFSHYAKLTAEEIANVEAMVNEKIRENIPVTIKKMPKEEALKMGAMALFGEKYGDEVRVVIIDPTYSVEFCGGTHVYNTGELGFFKIKHETAIAAGVRRIEVVSGKAVEEYVNEQFEMLHHIRNALKNPKEINRAIENLILENGELRKKVESLEAKQLQTIKNDLLQNVQQINGVNFIARVIDVSNADALKKITYELRSEVSNHAVILAANIGGKAFVSVSFDNSVVESKNLDANKIIKNEISLLINGNGGGQKTFATAGGQDASNLQQVIEKVKSLLR